MIFLRGRTKVLYQSEGEKNCICCRPRSLNMSKQMSPLQLKVGHGLSTNNWSRHEQNHHPPFPQPSPSPVFGCLSTILVPSNSFSRGGSSRRLCGNPRPAVPLHSFAQRFMAAKRPASQPSHPRRWRGRWFHPHRRRTPAESKWEGWVN